ncbi:MAG: pectin acetylesterase-family hydrolase [Gemmatimonadales bacterium]
MRRWLPLIFLVGWPAMATAQAWQAVHTDGAKCAKGGPWHFWVHRGAADKLLFYLQGGGGCWLKANCDLNDQPTFDSAVEERDHPANGDGILQLDRPANPFRGWTVVFVPYCTADVHLGSRPVDYDGVGMDHRGAANVAAALRWVQAEVRQPAEIVVAGGSAGAIPVPVYATRLAAAYPRARVTGIGDGAGGYRSPRIPGILRLWGVPGAIGDRPEFARIDSTGLTFESLYIAAGRARPGLRLAQINQDRDDVQVQFLALLGITGTPLAPLLTANLDEIQAAVPTFRRYLIPSQDHTILTRAEFYSTVVDGVGLPDWVAATIKQPR